MESILLAAFEAAGIRPRTCVWEITARCNLQCIHCASALGPRTSRGAELDSARALQLAGELAELGCEYVALSGGEPLLRRDWPRIASGLRDAGVRVGLISNGLLVDEAAVEAMVGSGISILAISIDGLEATHEAIRKRPGSFASAVQALRLGAQAGLRIHAITHVNRMNQGDLDALHGTLEELGVRTWLVQLSAPMGRMSEHSELVLTPGELPPFARWLADTKRHSRIYVAVGDNVGYFTGLEPVLRRIRPDETMPCFYGCSAGLLTIGIEANGNVKGCLSLQSQRFIEGNVTEKPLREIWQAPGAFAYTRSFETAELRDACSGCEYGEICRGGCTFMSVAATGQPHGSPYCLFALTRSE